jgi:hypothetical protein
MPPLVHKQPVQVYPSCPGRAFFKTDGPGSRQKAEVTDAFTSAERFHQIAHPVLEGSRAQIQHPYAAPEVLEAKLGPIGEQDVAQAQRIPFLEFLNQITVAGMTRPWCWRWGDSNSAASLSPARGRSADGRVTCDSRAPPVTADARRGPAVPDAMRTQRGPNPG